MKLRIILSGATGMVGRAMINAAGYGTPKPVLEVRDIVALAESIRR